MDKAETIATVLTSSAPLCPECKTVLTVVDVYISLFGSEEGEMVYDEKTNFYQYHFSSSDEGDIDNYEYSCPNCGNELSEEDLVKDVKW